MEHGKNDKIHLKDTGKEKLYGIVESDIAKIKETLAAEDEQSGSQAGSQSDFQSGSQSWASQISNTSQAPTPATLKKRVRETFDDDMSEDSETGKRPRKDSVIDRLDLLITEMRTDRTENKSRFTRCETKVEDIAKVMVEVRERVEELEERAEGEDLLTAEMREDIDGLENENLKSIVIIRKLPAAKPVPKDRKQLKTYIMETAKAIVADVLDEAAVEEIKFSSTLYATVDPKKKDNKEGLIPPFKIGFKTKDLGVKFREVAVKMAKEEGSHLATTYFTRCQSSATRLRAQLMWAVADAIKTKTKEVWVNQVSCKPMLQIKEGGKIVRSLGFIKAMQEYGEKIPKKTLEDATKIAKKFFAGTLEKTFIVIKD